MCVGASICVVRLQDWSEVVGLWGDCETSWEWGGGSLCLVVLMEAMENRGWGVSSVLIWICMSVAWIWVRTLGPVFSMLTVWGLNSESAYIPEWTQHVCLVVSFFSPLPFCLSLGPFFPLLPPPHLSLYFFFPILCQELFSIFFPVSLHFFSLSLLQASPRHHPAFSCSLFHCQSLTAFSSLLPCSISHSQSSSQSSLFITHFPLPSLISPAPFMCFWNPLFIFSALSLLPVLYLAHTYTHTLAHSVILLLSQN